MPNPYEERRFGRFSIANTLFRGAPWSAILAIFKDVIVVRVEENYSRQETEYCICSEAFDRVLEGEIMPQYQCEVQMSDGIINGITYRVTWTKMDNLGLTSHCGAFLNCGKKFGRMLRRKE